jgi:trk system potassium uptake protein TrkA
MKQFAIIGLGNFGYYLAVHLYHKGHDVMAIDRNANRVAEIKDQVSQALIADATDRKTMKALGLDKMDAAVICIGSVLSDSILATLHMKDLGIKQLYAKAINEAHSRILYKIGASEVFFPEKDQATSLAERLHNPNMLDYLPFIEGYSIVEMSPPKQFTGKSLRELDLINRFGVQVVAIKELVPDRLNLIPTAQYVLTDSCIMILLGPNKAIEKLRKANS